MRVLSFLMLIVLSCQPLYQAKRPYAVYSQPESFFQPVLSNDDKVVLANDSYPIYLELKPDKTFHYNLPKLGEGKGTWSYDSADGHLHLYAARTLFIMEMDIRSQDQLNDKKLALEFSDRFGPKFLNLEFRNGQ